MRILDSKNPQMQSLIANAPRLIDVVCESSRQYFLDLCEGLTELGIAHTINPFLVRGLDYYGHTVFEWVTEHLGSQATVCAGGRFDMLVEHLGGNSTPAIGFAMGMERILLLMETLGIKAATESAASIFLIATGDEGIKRALTLAETLHDHDKALKVIVNTSGGSFKSQFKKADKSGARLAGIIGEDELRDQTITIKDLRRGDVQNTISQNELSHYIQSSFG